MPELEDLLTQAAQEQRPAATPPFAALVQRRRSRDRRRRGALAALSIAVLAGGAGVLAAQDPDEDRVLPPADSVPSWAPLLRQDLRSVVRFTSGQAVLGASFEYPITDRIGKIVSMRYDGPLEAPLDGPVTVTARFQGETVCLRAEATAGRLVWAEPVRGTCTDTGASVLDQVLEVSPEQDRFPDQPIERTVEADGYLLSRSTPATPADDEALRRCLSLSGAYDGGRATEPRYDVVLFFGSESERPALQECLTRVPGVRVRETLTGRSLTPET